MKNFNSVSASASRRSAFTLIELLVVIAIIAILAAILFPVFGRARENARKSSCQSNLKQLGLSIEQYKADYDSYFPIQKGPAPAPGVWESVQPYIKSLQLLQCPSEVTPPNSNPDAAPYKPAPLNNGFSDYFFNSGLTNFPGGRNDSELEQPALTILTADGNADTSGNQLPYIDGTHNGYECNGIIWKNASTNCNDAGAYFHMLSPTAAIRHLEGANYAFTDGHVKFYKPEKIYGNQTPFTVSGNNPTFHPQGG